MQAAWDYLHEFNFISVLFRMLLALVCGGAVGYGRSKKERPAGLRTYMLISIGAAMSILLTVYEFEMLYGPWSYVIAEAGEIKFDASRLASQVITGIGFLGAGIIIKVAHQQVSGLTTATGLLATACMGLAAGAGFYEVVMIALFIIVLVLNVMSPLEVLFKRRLRNITLNVEFASIEDIDTITDTIRAQNASVYEIDVEQTKAEGGHSPSAIFILQLSRENASHSGMLSTVAELPCVYSVQELIS